MGTLTTRIVDYCKNNDTYNFQDSVTDLKDFKNNVKNLLIFSPGDIITYLKSNINCGIEEKRELENLINDIDNISYETLINGFLDSLVTYKVNNILLSELLKKKSYKRFIALNLTYIITDSLYIRNDINIKNDNLLTGYIATRFNNTFIDNKSILSIMDQIDYNYSYDELTSVTNKIRNEILI